MAAIERSPENDVNQKTWIDIHQFKVNNPFPAHEGFQLNIIERLNMFAPAITGDLIKTLQHSDAIGNSQREDITSRLVAKADALKATVVMPDPFIDRALFSQFPDQRSSMKIPELDENGVTRWKARIIGRSEAEPIERGRPRKKPATITSKTVPQANIRFASCATSSARFTWAELLRGLIGFASVSQQQQGNTSCCTNTSHKQFRTTASRVAR